MGTVDDDSDAAVACPCPRWKCEVGANLIGKQIGREYYHLFVRVTDLISLATPTYRAGPSADGQPSLVGIATRLAVPETAKTPEENYEASEDDRVSYGYIRVDLYDSFDSSIENTGYAIFGDAKELDINHNPGLVRHSQTIDGKKIRYRPLGPNSNSYAMTIVNEESIGVTAPDVWAPGKGIDLI